MRFKFVYILHFVIICLFIASIVFGILQYDQLVQMTGDYHLIFYNAKWITIFKSSLLLILPMIGVFIKKPIAWVLTIQYFYYALFEVLILGYENFNSINYTFYIALLIPVSLILFSNHNQITFHYKLNGFNIFRNNLISAIIGFTSSMMFLLINNQDFIQ